MKKSQFRALLREEIRKVMREGKVYDYELGKPGPRTGGIKTSELFIIKNGKKKKVANDFTYFDDEPDQEELAAWWNGERE